MQTIYDAAAAEYEKGFMPSYRTLILATGACLWLIDIKLTKYKCLTPPNETIHFVSVEYTEKKQLLFGMKRGTDHSRNVEHVVTRFQSGRGLMESCGHGERRINLPKQVYFYSMLLHRVTPVPKLPGQD